MKKIYILLLFTFFAVLLPAQDKAEQIDRLLTAFNSYNQFNGAVLVSEGGKVLFKKGYGYANFEWNIPNSTDTKFRLASITKQFTSLLIMQLVQEGKLTLDTKLSALIDYYPKDKGDKVTVHHLLTHSSGIPSYTGFPEFFPEQSKKYWGTEEFVKTFMDKDLEFEPGEKFQYNNSAYFLLGVIIEKLTGISYDEAIKQRIFDPIGMVNSGYDHNKNIISKRASGYEPSGLEYLNADYVDMSTPYAAGALYSTVEDMFLWDRALYTEKLLSKEMKTKMFSGYYKMDQELEYGYGWGIGTLTFGEKKANALLHSGGINGFNTMIVRLVDDAHSIIILCNAGGGAPIKRIYETIGKILYDQSYENPVKPLFRELAEIIDKEGLEAGKKYYQDKLSAGSKISERDMNALGYAYIRNGDNETAEQLFKWNIETYPDAFNVYDSYGELMLKIGKKEEAITNYKKTLELNPDNANARKVLASLGVEFEEAKPVVIAPDLFDMYIGKYQLAPEFIITISREAEKYYAQATNQPKFEIFPRTAEKFYLKVIDAQISFVKDNSGKYSSIILHQNGRDMPAMKVE